MVPRLEVVLDSAVCLGFLFLFFGTNLKSHSYIYFYIFLSVHLRERLEIIERVAICLRFHRLYFDPRHDVFDLDQIIDHDIYGLVLSCMSPEVY